MDNEEVADGVLGSSRSGESKLASGAAGGCGHITYGPITMTPSGAHAVYAQCFDRGAISRTTRANHARSQVFWRKEKHG